MKKTVSFLIILALLLTLPGIGMAAESQSSSTFNAAADTSQTILRFFVGKTIYYVNGSQKTLDVAPFIRENRTHLPIRFVAESLGATVSWDQLKKEVTIDFAGTVIKLWIGQTSAQVNGVNVPIDASNPRVVPIIVQSRTFIPIRFVLEALNSEVTWDSSDYSITVKYPRIAISMLSYESTAYGFRMKYPQGWTQLGQGMDKVAVMFLSPEGNSINVVVGDLPFPITLDEYINFNINKLKYTYPDINIIESGPTTLAGSPGYKLVYTVTLEGRPLKIMQVITIKNTKSYVVTYGSEVSIYPNHLGTAQEMINSFEIF
ncbi:MAG: DcrB-related protein [Actinobacteria bacterium]|nr:DcrB-related protein [Actinomycetota bacterium]